jgi:MFS family permease
VNLTLLQNPTFAILVIAGTTANVAYTVTVFLSTMNLQQVRGLTPLAAGIAFLGPSAGAALGGVLSGRIAARFAPVAVMGTGCTAAAVSLAGLAVSQHWVPYLAALTVCGFTMGLVYAFTTVATQTVVAPERAGEAAGVTLTALVTIAGVSVAASGTVLEVLQYQHFTTADGIERILLAIAALLLPAGLAVLWKARDGVANFTGKY